MNAMLHFDSKLMPRRHVTAAPVATSTGTGHSRWTAELIEKARAYELARLLIAHLAKQYPYLINCNLQQIIGRLAPVRRAPGNRMIRFYGRDCHFPHDDGARVAGFLMDQFMNGVGPVDQAAIVLSCDLPIRRKVSDVLKRTNAYAEGLIASNGEGLYAWQLPEDEKQKPPLVIIPNLP
jgi:hypothetical protein